MGLTLVLALILGPSGFAQQGTNRIYQGSVVTGQDPVAKYLVRLRHKNGDMFCSGTVYSSSMIVTAAHCMGQEDAEIEFVEPVTGKTIKACPARGQHIHSKYKPHTNPFAPNPTSKYDFGAYTFDCGLPPGFQPAPICTQKASQFQKITTYGFGLDGRKGTPTKQLQKTEQNAAVEKDMIKLTPIKGGGETCLGDSGGSNFGIDSEGQACWIGITSYIASRRPTLRRGTPGCSTAAYLADLHFAEAGLFEKWQGDTDLALGKRPPVSPSSSGGKR